MTEDFLSVFTLPSRIGTTRNRILLLYRYAKFSKRFAEMMIFENIEPFQELIREAEGAMQKLSFL